MSQWINFNFHNKVFMRVERSAPTASLFMDMFNAFITTDDLPQVDLTVTAHIEPLNEAAYGEIHGQADFKYTDKGVFLEDAGVQILKNGTGYHLQGTRELLVMALPLLDNILTERGLGMIHALTVDYRGHGVNMPAWGGVGKTSTMAKMLKIEGVGFMGDDWAFLSEDHRLLGFAKPMFIKPYHKTIYPHLFENRHKPLVPTRLSKPIARFTTLLHPLVTQYPRLARISRRYSPEHIMVRPNAAFPEAKFSTEAPLALSIFVERYDGHAPVLEEKDKKWMVGKMVGNFYAEMTRHSKVVTAALAAAGIASLEDKFGKKAEVIEKAIGDTPNYLLRVPKAYPPDQASDAIVSHIQQVLAATGVEVH